MAHGAGVTAEQALKVTGFLDVSAIVSGRGKTMASRNYTPAFELAMARKDVRLMLETAGDKPLAMLPGIAARMDALIAGGHGEQDLAVMGFGAGGSRRRFKPGAERRGAAPV